MAVQQSGTWQDGDTDDPTLDVAPGDTLQLRATLACVSHSHKSKKVDITVHIPADAGSGDGDASRSRAAEISPSTASTRLRCSVAELLKALKAAPHGNDLVTQLLGAGSNRRDCRPASTITRLKKVHALAR